MFVHILPPYRHIQALNWAELYQSKWILPGNHYFAGLIPSTEALSQEPLYPNEHLQESLALYL